MMKNIFYLVCCLALLQSCDLRKKNTYNNLPKDKLYVFKTGDTLLYTCTNEQLVDTIIVGNIKFDYVHGEHLYTQYENIVLLTKVDINYGFSTGIDGASIGWKDLSEYVSFLWNHTSYHVLNKEINDVYIISNSNKPETIVTKQVYFSPSYGFVRVIYANNDTFDLYKVIPL